MKNQLSTGEQFNNWTVLSFAGTNKKHEQLYNCQCICGTIRQVRKDNLGKVTGCGCVRNTPKKYKTKAATNIINKHKIIQKNIIKGQIKETLTEETNKPPSTTQRIARKLEEIRLAQEIQNQYSLTNY